MRGDQRATETAHRAWLLTRRDRADAIARSASLWRTPRNSPNCDVGAVLPTDISSVSAKRRESSGRPSRTRVTMRRKPLRTSVGDPC